MTALHRYTREAGLVFEGLEILPRIKTISEEVGKGKMVGLHLERARIFELRRLSRLPDCWNIFFSYDFCRLKKNPNTNTFRICKCLQAALLSSLLLCLLSTYFFSCQFSFPLFIPLLLFSLLIFVFWGSTSDKGRDHSVVLKSLCQYLSPASPSCFLNIILGSDFSLVV